jgi:hypothetical protein
MIILGEFNRNPAKPELLYGEFNYTVASESLIALKTSATVWIALGFLLG